VTLSVFVSTKATGNLPFLELSASKQRLRVVHNNQASILFGMNTAALHRDSGGQARLRKLMQPLGITHACLLFLAMVALGGMTYSRVMSEPGAGPLHCSCSIRASVPQK